MLQSMRDNSKGLVAGILVGLLVIVFALSGAEALFSSRNQTQVAATINGDEVSETDVARAIERQRAQMRNRFGDAVPEDFLSDENLRGEAMDRLIERTLLAQFVRDSDMTIAPQQIDNRLISDPTFQDASGQFDPEAYRMLLARSAYTPTSYRAELTRDLSISQLVTGLTQSNFATEGEVTYVAELNNQLRSFDFLTLSAESLLEEIELEEQAISSYYESNSQDYAVPEKVAVEYIELSIANLMQDIEISEELIRSQYEENVDNFTPTIERHVAHILIEEPTDEKIQQVQSAIDSGRDFSEIATEFSDDLGSKDLGGDLGITNADAFPDTFEEALAELSEGEVSGPVETDSGTHFIKLISIDGDKAAPFAEQKDQIAQELQRVRAEEQFVELSIRLEDLSYNAQSLEDVGQELELDVVTTEPFSRDGGAGIASSGAVVRAAFDEEVLEYGNASELLELAPDRVVVIKKVDHQPSFVQPLAEVREEIVAQLKQEQAMALLSERGSSIVEQLRSGSDIESLAEQEGLEFQQASLIQRSDLDQPRRVVEFAFSLPLPEDDATKVSAGKGLAGEYIIVQLTDVDTPEGELDAEQKSALGQALSSMYGAVDFESMSGYLRESAEIE
ncbi:SurA N-terminal domain-containing protein [Gilvimarinus agarilyticus]|uniref:SurA N-terminal domain-containing protein n=1 Tax=Gilvimarinus sp. 2_MG-2023 TaxID=3062666 RepID=UPI001C08EE26|nr:SurA N-terminal domain-containing protein [Gilvimarinus sp. 2_MG-2023]MBU2887068.1 SurA N-terminal domain-containing protein [Gilvimarinus agarilyticus]MDO6571727.1 SurA N-terminal domain-containing protein [Gilvimarinus sp. 2_MG-2023]